MLKKLFNRILLKEKASSKDYVAFLKKAGVSIGKDVVIYAPTHSVIDTSCPWLLTIGDHVRITQGVIILTHDYSWFVLKNHPESTGSILGAQSPVTIGNNVFIGMNAIITRGVTIGDNVVIGAGSVVTKDCEPDSVYAGNPARKIMTIGEYLKKREENQFSDAKKMALRYREKFGCQPPKEEFREYFMLFSDVTEAKNTPAFLSQMRISGGYSDSALFMENHPPMFANYEAFLETCFQDA